MKLLVTGGAGFIGSALVRMLIRESEHTVLNLDKLSYAGNLENLVDVAEHPRYRFVKGDIADTQLVSELFRDYRPDAVLHLAAESHVDRSILSPLPAFQTNLQGSFVLLDTARQHGVGKFVHVSTDEVYGSLEEPHDADESYPLRPSSPYSASKAGSDLLALSYHTTYKLPVCVTRASNNYGPYQFPEKLIPLMISNALDDKPLPIYGDGMQVRDWLFVDDHCRGILAVLDQGRLGEVYNIAGTCSLPNRTVVEKILAGTGKPSSLMTPVTDRPGHDRRYALTSAKLEGETGWKSRVDFEQGLAETVRWYQTNRDWVARVRSGDYQKYYQQQYGGR